MPTWPLRVPPKKPIISSMSVPTNPAIQSKQKRRERLLSAEWNDSPLNLRPHPGERNETLTVYILSSIKWTKTLKPPKRDDVKPRGAKRLLPHLKNPFPFSQSQRQNDRKHSLPPRLGLLLLIAPGPRIRSHQQMLPLKNRLLPLVNDNDGTHPRIQHLLSDPYIRFRTFPFLRLEDCFPISRG